MALAYDQPPHSDSHKGGSSARALSDRKTKLPRTDAGTFATEVMAHDAVFRPDGASFDRIAGQRQRGTVFIDDDGAVIGKAGAPGASVRFKASRDADAFTPQVIGLSGLHYGLGEVFACFWPLPVEAGQFAARFFQSRRKKIHAPP